MSRRFNLPLANHAVKITADIIELGDKGVDLFIADNGLTIPATPLIISVANTAKKNVSTIAEYGARWLEVKKFCYLKGDYQSAALCHRTKCPVNPLPFRSETFMEYLDFKYTVAGTILKKHGTELPLLDVLGRTIKCQGTWHSPELSDKIRSAVYCLHNAYENLRGNYVVKCPTCVSIHNAYKEDAAFREGTYGACQQHASGSVLNSSGNVLNCVDVKNKLNRWKANMSAYVKKGSMQMTPMQVRQLRSLLLSSNDINDMKAYVMILLGIKLFLRASELVKLKMENFDDVQRFQIVSLNNVRALCVKVKGKCDPKPVTLMIFSDDDNPEFCPVRHLLAYIERAGIKKGFLFPPDVDLTNGKADGHYKSHVTYKHWLKMMRYLLGRGCLKLKLGKGCLGTHTLRKTGYLFAYWGVMGAKFWRQAEPTDKNVPELALSNIMKAARHRTVANAGSYQQDAATVLAIIEREQHPEMQRVSRWESIYLNENGNANYVNAASLVFQKPLVELADYFFVECLHLKSANSDISTLMGLICSIRPIQSKEDQLMKLLEKYVPDALKNEAIELLAGSISEAFAFLQHGGAAVGDEDTAATTTGAARSASAAAVSRSTASRPATSSTIEGQPKKKKQRVRKGGDDDLIEREEVAKCGKDHKAKMTKVKALYDRVEAGDNKSRLTEKARQWYTKNVVKPMKCLTICHEGSIDQFVAVAVPAFFLLQSKDKTTDRAFPTHEYRCVKCKGNGG
jgi:hypothetical protein